MELEFENEMSSRVMLWGKHLQISDLDEEAVGMNLKILTQK